MAVVARLDRAIAYPRTRMVDAKAMSTFLASQFRRDSHHLAAIGLPNRSPEAKAGILDRPLQPVAGRRSAPTRWRVTTANPAAHPHVPSQPVPPVTWLPPNTALARFPAPIWRRSHHDSQRATDVQF